MLDTRILDQPILTNEKNHHTLPDPFRTLKINSRTNLHIEQTKNERKSKNKTSYRQTTPEHHGTTKERTNIKPNKHI